jgi:hypothetical protein
MTNRINHKPNKMLNGKSWRWGDLYDTWNNHQQQHFDGIIDVYAPVVDANGSSLPSLAQQWKDAYNRRKRK